MGKAALDQRLFGQCCSNYLAEFVISFGFSINCLRELAIANILARLTWIDMDPHRILV